MDLTPTAPSTDLPSMLLALMVENRGAQTEAARGEVEHQSKLLDEMRERIEAAMQRAAEADNDAGFWGDVTAVLGGDVAAIAGVVAAAALVVASGGTGAPAILALTAAGLSAGAKVGEELGLDPKLCLLLGAAGGLLGFAGGNVATASSVWSGIATGAQATQGAATAASGGARIVEGQYRGDALDARADVTRVQALEDDAWFRLETALSLLEQASRDLGRERSSIADIQRTLNEGNHALVAQMGAVP